jgi:hypothetical protein
MLTMSENICYVHSLLDIVRETNRMSPTLTATSDPPQYLERRAAVYIGRVTDTENSNAEFAYYIHGRDDLFLGNFSEDGFEPQYALSTDTDTMGETIATFHDIVNLQTELSLIGQALYDAHDLAETGVIGVQQAYVYVLRHVYGFNQQDTAKILDIGFSTVSTHLSDARQNVESALDFAEQYNKLSEKKETAFA